MSTALISDPYRMRVSDTHEKERLARDFRRLVCDRRDRSRPSSRVVIVGMVSKPEVAGSIPVAPVSHRRLLQVRPDEVFDLAARDLSLEPTDDPLVLHEDE